MKIFVIGLPRTGTTSLCALLLSLGYKVAHTAYTKEAFEQADVVADMPVFSDYAQLDRLYPHSKFIYLERSLEQWLPSIQGLLPKIAQRIAKNSGGFNAILKRSYEQTFFSLAAGEWQNNVNASVLGECYERHQAQIFAYFGQESERLLRMQLDGLGAIDDLTRFVCSEEGDATQKLAIPHLNGLGRVNDWQSLKHPRKVDSYAFGPNRRKFLDYPNSG